MALVSIIVPCYNKGKYIEETLNSILLQTYQEWECIIVNDGSTDNSEEIIQKFIKNDNRFKYIFIENSGVCIARNTAIESSTGKYIFPLDGDDLIADNCLFECVSAFCSKENIKLVRIGGFLFGDENKRFELVPYSFKSLLINNSVHNSSMFLKEDWQRVGGYRNNMIFNNEDWDFWISLLSIYNDNQVFSIDEPLFYYRYIKKTRRENLSIKDRNDLMLNTMVFNNYFIYLHYFPNIFERIIRYDYFNTITKKAPIRLLIKLLTLFHISKQIIFKK